MDISSHAKSFFYLAHTQTVTLQPLFYCCSHVISHKSVASKMFFNLFLALKQHLGSQNWLTCKEQWKSV